MLHSKAEKHETALHKARRQIKQTAVSSRTQLLKKLFFFAHNRFQLQLRSYIRHYMISSLFRLQIARLF